MPLGLTLNCLPVPYFLGIPDDEDDDEDDGVEPPTLLLPPREPTDEPGGVSSEEPSPVSFELPPWSLLLLPRALPGRSRDRVRSPLALGEEIDEPDDEEDEDELFPPLRAFGPRVLSISAMLSCRFWRMSMSFSCR